MEAPVKIGVQPTDPSGKVREVHLLKKLQEVFVRRLRLEPSAGVGAPGLRQAEPGREEELPPQGALRHVGLLREEEEVARLRGLDDARAARPEPRDRPHDGRLAAPRLAHHEEGLPRGDLEGEVARQREGTPRGLDGNVLHAEPVHVLRPLMHDRLEADRPGTQLSAEVVQAVRLRGEVAQRAEAVDNHGERVQEPVEQEARLRDGSEVDFPAEVPRAYHQRRRQDGRVAVAVGPEVEAGQPPDAPQGDDHERLEALPRRCVLLGGPSVERNGLRILRRPDEGEAHVALAVEQLVEEVHQLPPEPGHRDSGADGAVGCDEDDKLGRDLPEDMQHGKYLEDLVESRHYDDGRAVGEGSDVIADSLVGVVYPRGVHLELEVCLVLEVDAE
eukprot:CAMPEP_0177602978 /NCGR_PEP_ID=MMETSP0419_2-20121207/15221_1 /TAXON_ID=582737 /ORGANISM="Tetraselmis sp., Strain GSL018" /LENGTH=387 /DNA_ID=CAMNT_0019096627 /DNA_START=379 /DNA_END=1541 /DNA_ORIENTATION=+